MKLLKILTMIALFSNLHGGTKIIWQSDFGATNLMRDRVTILDSSFTFALGGFPEDFTPTSANISEWEERWVALETTAYNGLNKLFSESSTLNFNDAPFRTTDKVYIWGYNTLNSGSEWFLVSSSEWKWPVAAVGPPTPGNEVTINLSDATNEDVIVGSLNLSGFHIQTELITTPLSYADWVLANFNAGELSAPEDDPDLDGRSNLLEYAVGSHPKKNGDSDFIEITRDRQIRIDRLPNREVNWTLEGSSTLAGFIPLTIGFEMIGNRADRLVFRITDPSLRKSFYRAKVTFSF